MAGHQELSELSSSAPEQPVCSNMVKMRYLDELSCLRNLEVRFKQDAIYTYVGTVLISVNPFRQLPLYTPDVREWYVGTHVYLHWNPNATPRTIFHYGSHV
eukprot:204684-Pyramimonas_sp.AAC.1